jgi:hypothetical protein
MKKQLQRALSEGKELLANLPRSAATIVLHLRAPTSREDVEEWISWVALLLKKEPAALARFQREPRRQPASLIASASEDQLRRRLQKKIANLEEIIGGL